MRREQRRGEMTCMRGEKSVEKGKNEDLCRCRDTLILGRNVFAYLNTTEGNSKMVELERICKHIIHCSDHPLLLTRVRYPK